MQTIIILLLITAVFSFIILAGWIMETIVAKIETIRKTAYKTKHSQIQHNV